MWHSTMQRYWHDHVWWCRVACRPLVSLSVPSLLDSTRKCNGISKVTIAFLPIFTTQPFYLYWWHYGEWPAEENEPGCLITDVPVLLPSLPLLSVPSLSSPMWLSRGCEEEHLSQSVNAALIVASCSRDVLVLCGCIRFIVGAPFCILAVLLHIS